MPNITITVELFEKLVKDSVRIDTLKQYVASEVEKDSDLVYLDKKAVCVMLGMRLEDDADGR